MKKISLHVIAVVGLALASTSCATTETTVYGETMTFREAKERDYDIWERNQTAWWAQPAMVWKGIRQFSGAE